MDNLRCLEFLLSGSTFGDWRITNFGGEPVGAIIAPSCLKVHHLYLTVSKFFGIILLSIAAFISCNILIHLVIYDDNFIMGIARTLFLSAEFLSLVELATVLIKHAIVFERVLLVFNSIV